MNSPITLAAVGIIVTMAVVAIWLIYKLKNLCVELVKFGLMFALFSWIWSGPHKDLNVQDLWNFVSQVGETAWLLLNKFYEQLMHQHKGN
jgi:hypothetical protein